MNQDRATASVLPLALLCAVGGAAGGLALPPHDLWPLALVCLGPLLWAARLLSWWKAALCGLAWGVAQAAVVFAWLPGVIAAHGGLSWPLTWAMATLGYVYQGLFTAAFAVALRLPRRWPALTLAAAPLAWVAMEQARALVGLRLPWLPLGQALAAEPFLLQSAELWGVMGLSTLAAGVNALFWAALWPRRVFFSRFICLTLAAMCLIAPWLWGQERRAVIHGMAAAAPKLAVCAVQGDFDLAQLRDKSAARAVVARLEQLTRAAVDQRPQRPLLVAWPETAAPYYLFQTVSGGLAVRYLAMELKTYLALGARGAVETDQGLKPTNRLWLLNPDGAAVAHYDKTKLAPYGEFAPPGWPRQWLPPLAGGQDLWPGQSIAPLDLGPAKIGALICFESAFAGLARRQTTAGADLLLNVANEAWFDDQAAPRQAVEQLRLRAVENRRACLRAANRGPSGLIGPDGAARLTDGPSLYAVAPLMNTRTLYDRHWPWPTIGLSLALAALTFLAARAGAKPPAPARRLRQ